jgi:hypothetical protein
LGLQLKKNIIEKLFRESRFIDMATLKRFESMASASKTGFNRTRPSGALFRVKKTPGSEMTADFTF